MFFLNSIARILIVFLYMSVHYVDADEGILEAPRLARPDSVVQFRFEIIRRNFNFVFHTNLN